MWRLLPPVLLLASCIGAQTDWPTYRADASRSAHTSERLPDRMRLLWTWRSAHAPRPAWPRLQRMAFDRAFQPIIAGGTVYLGSSADGKVYALDAATGRERWVFYTDGPVRFAPACAAGRVYVASDDGRLYCLAARDGSLLWQKRGGPDDRLILGNGRPVSRWPARGGPVVAGGVVYFAAGIWPTEGIYVHALDAVTGATLWRNEEAGHIYMGQPHGGAYAESGVSAQGHLVLTDELLLVPTGRAVPAAFKRSTGAFEYFHLQKNGHRGGTATMASGKYFFNSGTFFDAKTGTRQGKTGAAAIAGLPNGVVTATAKEVAVFEWQKNDTGRRTLRKVRGVPAVGLDRSIVVAGRTAVAGGAGGFARLSLVSGEMSHTRVTGTVHGLAVAGRRLFVSTDKGEVLCYGDGSASTGTAPERRVVESKPWPAIAAEIVERSGVRAGFCVDLGCGDGRLALALARRTDLHVIAIEDDATLVARARAMLDGAGVYGDRVTVLCRPLANTGLPPYLADLVVSARSATAGGPPAAEAARIQRPAGGVVCVGPPGNMHLQRRGPLPGAGSWTHQYADPANTVCSNDTVRGPLGVLWFREVDQSLTQRHGRGPSPLYLDGRLFSLGLDELVAVDAYNGRTLWRHPFPGILTAFDGDHLMGTAGTNSCYCVTADGVYVRTGDRCSRLDPATGRKLGELRAPPGRDGERAPWAFIASEGGLLFGSLADPDHVVTYRYRPGGDMSKQLTESTTLFALDAKTGTLKWRYDARHSIRHNAISIGGGRVFLIDRPLALADREKNKKVEQHETGSLIAIDAKTGRPIWENREGIWGTLLALSAPHGALMMSYQPTRFRLASELGGKIAVFDAASGRMIWETESRYDSRPVINDRTIYAQGGAWDLLTGTTKAFPFERSYGCGVLASGTNLMVYRSATLGYWDLTSGTANEDFGGIRPGCWINALPAGGLVLVPDGSAGCVCSYQNKAWVALYPNGLRAPIASVAGGAFREPVSVTISPVAGVDARYTLDGSTPDRASPRYRGPIRIDRSATLKLRAFDRAQASRVVSHSFVVDADLLPLGADRWRVWDAPNRSGASSEWRVSRGTVTQSSNIHGPAGPMFYGTLRIYEKTLQDGDLSLQVRSSDDDGIGVAFRLRDERNHYLLDWNRQRKHRVLTRRQGDEHVVLARDDVPFEPNRWYDVRVSLRGPKITVFVDDRRVFAVEDGTFRDGRVALHSWGSRRVEFRAIRWKD